MTVLPLALHLTHEWANCLLAFIRVYRRYTLTQVPSNERNTHQRVLQALQGRLIVESEREHVFSFLLSREEVQALQEMVHDLTMWNAQKEPKTEQTYQLLVKLTRLKRALEHYLPSEPKRSSTKSLV